MLGPQGVPKGASLGPSSFAHLAGFYHSFAVFVSHTVDVPCIHGVLHNSCVNRSVIEAYTPRDIVLQQRQLPIRLLDSYMVLE